MTNHTSFEPIAIVAMACEFAGGIHTPTDFWHALEESRDLGSEIPIERTDILSYTAHMFNQDNGDLQQKLIRRGYFLPTSVLDTFDASYFNLADGEASSIDPAHRLLMLKFVHLIEDAGYTLEMMRGSRTAVYIGQFSNDHAMASLRLKPEHRTRFHCPHILLYNASARLSYHFDLRGPNVSLDTACSSSLQAIHFGVQALRTGEADMAVCGGVNTIFTPEQLLSFSVLSAVSADGRSRSFSIDANGYAKGEGLGLVLLKRLKDAERDNDKIYCVLHDILSNHDGCEDKKGYVIPSTAGQEHLLDAVYTRTQYDRKRIFYVEAHGTGTQVGDPIEANAIGNFFQRSPLDPPLLIGSVKSNVGHTEGTAGMASFIKVVMSIKQRKIPPNMHFTALNPKIEAQRFNLHVVQTLVPFPLFNPNNENDNPVAIGINSFGIGGNNAHAIVEEYRPKQISTITNGHIDQKQFQQHFLFIFSTKSSESLKKQVAAFNTWLSQIIIPDDEQSFLARVSQQCLLKRTISHEHLTIFISANLIQLREQLDSFLSQNATSGVIISKRLLSNNPRVCFVISGQGPQWWAMGRQLYSCEPVFRRWIQLISNEFSQINKGEFNLLNEMIEKTEENSRINDTNIAQPAIFSIQVGLAALLLSWHIFPSAIVSHSAGEQAASFIAGRFSLKEAVCIVYHRSRLQHRNTRQGGGMLAVAMSEQEVHDLLLQGIEHLVCVAVVNSPRSVTISGEETVISEIETILSTFHPKVFKARLRIQNAFHSHQMDRFDIKKEMFSSLGHIKGLPIQDEQLIFDVNCAHVPFYSSVTGHKVDDSMPLDAQYWWTNVRQSVRFGDAIQSIINDDIVDAFLELSPHPVLAISISECYEKTNTTHPVILSTLKRKEEDQTTLLSSIVQLSYSPDVWKHYLASRSAKPTQDMEHLFDTYPLYAFNTTPCWYESKESVMERRAYRRPTHPLLGVRQWSEHTTATWKSLINIKSTEHAYLIQHKMQDAILFPATGFLELALAACRQLLPITTDNEMPPPIAFENVEFIKALVLTEHELTEVITQIAMPMHEWFIYSRPWSSSGHDCMRPTGMACDDFVDSFVDSQALNTYSLRQFTLHARGHIDIGPHLNIYASLATRFKNKAAHWTDLDSVNIYPPLSTRGYQYDSSFQLTDSVKTNKSKVISRVSPRNGEDNDNRYHLHPVIIDSCMHGPLSVLPGVETFLPATIGKMIAYGSTFHVPEVISYAIYHSSLVGLSQERAYTLDAAIFDSRDEMAGSNTKPIVMLQMFKVQRVPGHWSLLKKTLIEKVNELASLPNGDFTNYMNVITTDYCLQKKWTPILTDSTKTVDLLPSADMLINKIEQMVKIKIDDDDIDTQLTNSIESLNVLAANYSLYALQHLSSSKNTPLIIEDELQHHVQSDDPYFLWLFQSILSLVRHHGLVDERGNSSVLITNHALQLIRKQILDRFPLLKSILTVINVTGLQLASVLSGNQSVGDLLMKNKDIELALADVLNIISSSKTNYVFQALLDHLRAAHPKHLRVLIVGSGTSSIALPILQQLINFAEQTDTFIKLLYVDLTEALLAEVAQSFQTILIQDEKKNQRVSVSYSVYDMQAELNESNVPDEAHDIVFAANVLQTTVDVIHSLDSLRRLLVPHGLLILLELTLTHSYFDLLFGIFPQWWRDEDTRGLLTVDQWAQAIESAGGFDLPIVASKQTQFGDTLIISRKTTSRSILLQLPEWQDQAWLLLGNSTQNLWQTLQSHLPSSNVILLEMTINIDDICLKIKSILTQYRQLHIVFAWSLDSIQLGQNNDEIALQKQEDLCIIFIRILQTIQKYHQMDRPFPYVFVLTQNSQVISSGQNIDLSAVPLIGLARSLSIEYASHHIKLIDLQPTVNMFSDSSLSHIFIQHLINSRTADDLDEIVLRQDAKGHMQCFKWHYDLLQTKQHDTSSITTTENAIIPKKDADSNPFRLQVAPSRFVADLTWTRELVPMNNLLPDQILVRIHCIGLNFRDALKARGLYPHSREFAQLDKDQPLYDQDSSFGADFMGTIVRSQSNRFNIGDRVIGLSLFGAFHSHVIIDAHSVLLVPKDCLMSDEQLVALPTAFLTALFALKHRIRLKRDHFVLIHAATGATGQACIQYCQAVGAQVIATAGSDEKRQFLRKHYGIEHVFNSRDLSFASEVRSLVPNGVNVVVNSLSGPFLQESIKLLAPHGHFVELGKRDLYNKSHLSMFDLREDCTFHVIDLVSHGRDESNSIREMMEDMMNYYQTSIFKPIQPLTIFEPSEVVDAFTQTTLGQSMGKIVVNITNSEKPLLIKKSNSNKEISENEQEETMFPSIVCDSGTILISGGLGGLGLTISRWMVEKRGVKRIILMSRRTLTQFEKADKNPQLNDWIRLKEIGAKHGVSIDVVQVDVTRFNDVFELIERLNKTTHPVRGIIHSAVISDDKLLANLNKETLVNVMGPKVRGGWNLHQASQLVHAPLHFFIVFSSIRNHLIDPGSSSYNAGNEFFEALAQYRYQQLRLPALCVGLPGVSGAGMFHRKKDLLASLYSSQGLEILPTIVTFEIVEKLFITQTYGASPIVFAVNWQVLNTHKDNLSNHQLVEIIQQQANRIGVSQITGNSLDDPSTITVEIIIDRTRATVMRLLGISIIDRIDINRSLLSHGMDSLAAVSLYNWLVQEWNVIIPLADIFQGISIQQIADQVYNKLKDRLDAASTVETTASIDMENAPSTEKTLGNSTTNQVLLYNGMERVISMLPVKDSKSIIFYISTNTTIATETLAKFINNKSTVYVIHAQNDKSNMEICVRETIAQIRRLQPHGPYSLLPISNESKHVVHEIVKQLQHYVRAGVNHHY